MDVPLFKLTYKEIKPVLEEIISSVLSAPDSFQRLTKHIDRMGAIVQYAYYVSVVRSYLPKTDLLLIDWGGQHGQVTKLLQHYFPKTECYLANVDLETKFWHEKLSIQPVKTGFAPEEYKIINYDSNYVDVVISSGVLEHTWEFGVSELEALQEIYRILKKDGLLFIWNLPCKYGAVEMLNMALGRWHHQRRYFQAEIIDLLDKSGFEILSIDRHELMNLMSRNALGKMIGYENAFIFDYYISKLPIFNLIAQHFTIVARKKIS